MKTSILSSITFALIALGVAYAGNDLPLSDHIKILKVTPYGEKTRDIFEILTDDFSYQNLFRLIQEKIKNGYKPNCHCDFDNDYLLALNQRKLLETEQLSQPFVDFKRKTIPQNHHPWVDDFIYVILDETFDR